jgi:GDP-L-fucose synthase
LDSDENFEVWGTGNPLREFLYVDDLASAISFIVENDISEELINIGSNQEVSIKELVKILMRVVSFNGEIVFNSDYPDGNPRKLLDSSKISSYGWEPQIDISKGLELTYDWYLENIDN